MGLSILYVSKELQGSTVFNNDSRRGDVGFVFVNGSLETPPFTIRKSRPFFALAVQSPSLIETCSVLWELCVAEVSLIGDRDFFDTVRL